MGQVNKTIDTLHKVMFYASFIGLMIFPIIIILCPLLDDTITIDDIVSDTWVMHPILISMLLTSEVLNRIKFKKNK